MSMRAGNSRPFTPTPTKRMGNREASARAELKGFGRKAIGAAEWEDDGGNGNGTLPDYTEQWHAILEPTPQPTPQPPEEEKVTSAWLFPQPQHPYEEDEEPESTIKDLSGNLLGFSFDDNDAGTSPTKAALAQVAVMEFTTEDLLGPLDSDEVEEIVVVNDPCNCMLVCICGRSENM